MCAATTVSLDMTYAESMVQIKDYVRENRVFEKQFVKETRFTGNETQKGISDSVELSNRDSIIEATPASAPCVGCGCAGC